MRSLILGWRLNIAKPSSTQSLVLFWLILLLYPLLVEFLTSGSGFKLLFWGFGFTSGGFTKLFWFVVSELVVAGFWKLFWLLVLNVEDDDTRGTIWGLLALPVCNLPTSGLLTEAGGGEAVLALTTHLGRGLGLGWPLV